MFKKIILSFSLICGIAAFLSAQSTAPQELNSPSLKTSDSSSVPQNVSKSDGGEIPEVPKSGEGSAYGTASVSTEVVKMGDLTAEPKEQKKPTPPPAPVSAQPTYAGDQPASVSASNAQTIFGWVDPKALNKALQVKIGTHVYQHESTKSPILATVQAGDTVEVLGMGDEMVEVKLIRGSTKVVEQAPVQAAPVSVSQPVAQSTPAPAPASMNDDDMNRLRNAYVDPNGNDTGKLSSFEGTLKKAWALIGPGSKYNYKLVDPNGNLIGYVDFTKFRDEETMKSYLDRDMIINGSTELLTSNGDLIVIKAISARAK